jgi:hypothetical protein
MCGLLGLESKGGRKWEWVPWVLEVMRPWDGTLSNNGKYENISSLVSILREIAAVALVSSLIFVAWSL